MIRDLMMILFVTCTTIGGQLLLKRSVMRIASSVPVPKGVDWLVAAFTQPGVWMAILIQGIGFVVWVVVISRVKLGLAFAFAGACLYLLMPLVTWQLYGERLAPLQWFGISLIATGVLMVSLVTQPV